MTKRRRFSKAILAKRAEVMDDLAADLASGWTLDSQAGEVDLEPLRDAIEQSMSKEQRKRARSGAFHQQGELL